MKNKLINFYFINPNMWTNKFWLFFCVGTLASCSNFVEVDPPKNLLISASVFEDPSSVESAFANIYIKLRDEGMVSGRYGLSTMMGVYSDELNYHGLNPSTSDFYHHKVGSYNEILLNWWGSAYRSIYATNNIIEGVNNSEGLTSIQKEHFRGQALFVRAYLHSLLLNIFGNVPYITSTDYSDNKKVNRMPDELVSARIIEDLHLATELLKDKTVAGGNLLPNQSTAFALLARIYLYNENWAMADKYASQLIASHALEQDLEKVFRKNSKSTIWQLQSGTNPKNTHEANEFVIQVIPGQQFSISLNLLNAFEVGDLRMVHWTNSKEDAETNLKLYFPYKYKATFLEDESMEHSILFRMEEQYLIRAEARTHLQNLNGAKQDLNVIRNRVNLSDTQATTTVDLLEAILLERFVEFFTEQGFRWFDLKRTKRAAEVLSIVKTNWASTNVLFPIPENEIVLNPNLLPQNEGY